MDSIVSLDYVPLVVWEIQSVLQHKHALKVNVLTLVKSYNVDQMRFARHQGTGQFAFAPEDFKEMLGLVDAAKQNVRLMLTVLKIDDATIRVFVLIHANRLVFVEEMLNAVLETIDQNVLVQLVLSEIRRLGVNVIKTDVNQILVGRTHDVSTSLERLSANAMQGVLEIPDLAANAHQ